ncbi:MAG TPA: transcriptional repressor [Chitinophagaceae bacterium]|jgi:Fur family ferric uptake transcriptional regulator|nr:transcriptional repressor [Chitinophagaceae bacterium]
MEIAPAKSLEFKVSDILKKKRLSVTDSRKKILLLFLNTTDALAHGDIERKAGEKFDRVTVYRTLQVFVEKGIIHTIPTAENTVLYALCKDCEEDHHHDDHVHFVCRVCKTTICLDDVVSPDIVLPLGFSAENTQVIINGVCRECNR